MNLTWKKALLVGVTTLLCAFSATACGGVNLQAGDSGLYDKKNDISYSHASPVYEATSLLKEYGKLTVTSKESYALYTIPGTEPSEMLATEDFNIVYSSEMDMPTLVEMNPTILRVCRDSIEVKRLDDAALVSSLATAYENNEAISYPGLTPHQNYKVRFESASYPGFYYTLTYVEYSADLVVDGQNYGKYFLYDAFDQRFVPVDDSLHKAVDTQ